MKCFSKLIYFQLGKLLMQNAEIWLKTHFGDTPFYVYGYLVERDFDTRGLLSN